MKCLKYLYLLLFIYIIGCANVVGPKRVGPKAQYYFLKAEPIIKALSEYKTANKKYPVNLKSLSPSYLNSFDWSEKNYRINGRSYDLWFDYKDDGINRCMYKPNSKWKCS